MLTPDTTGLPLQVALAIVLSVVRLMVVHAPAGSGALIVPVLITLEGLYAPPRAGPP